MSPPLDFLEGKTRRLGSLKLNIQGETEITVEVLDQLRLPHVFEYLPLETSDHAKTYIRCMNVRGAPLIANVGLFGLAKECKRQLSTGAWTGDFLGNIKREAKELIATRPTAVNLRNALDKLLMVLEEASDKDDANITSAVFRFAIDLYDREQGDNRQLCWNGVQEVRSRPSHDPAGYTVMTICNTGMLATTSWGTALGIVYGLHAVGSLKHVICLETRPYNQGSRLSAAELQAQGLPYTLVTDSMAASAILHFKVDVVIVGADQVALNGDTANKIGTFNLATVANALNVQFIVALPHETFSDSSRTGADIVIEERPANEFRKFNGAWICNEETPVWNPAFDVTPARLIDSYVTERGAYSAEELRELRESQTLPSSASSLPH